MAFNICTGSNWSYLSVVISVYTDCDSLRYVITDAAGVLEDKVLSTFHGLDD